MRDWEKHSISINQPRLIDHMLARFNMVNTKVAKTWCTPCQSQSKQSNVRYQTLSRTRWFSIIWQSLHVLILHSQSPCCHNSTQIPHKLIRKLRSEFYNISNLLAISVSPT